MIMMTAMTVLLGLEILLVEKLMMRRIKQAVQVSSLLKFLKYIYSTSFSRQFIYLLRVEK
jgi:predicted membrane-bound spermidine synthase